MNKIILTGGGTAGHVVLNIALKDELKKHFDQIFYIGSKTGIEKQLIKNKTDYKYYEIDTVKLDRKKLYKIFSIPFKLNKSVNEAKNIINKIKPDVIFSKGGYVGLPVVIAGKKLGVPVVAHESDLSMGLANKLAKKYANSICTNFKITADKNGKKCIFTGMPIKKQQISKENAKNKLKINLNKPMLLVTGGSLGSKAINETIFNCADQLTEKYYVYHIVGKGNLNKKITLADYKQVEFENDMETVQTACDLAISRAGANTLIELVSKKIPTIFIPLPKGTSRGDQVENANYFEKIGVSLTLYQENLNQETLFQKLDELNKKTQNIKNNIKKANICDGTKKIIDEILKQKNTTK